MMKYFVVIAMLLLLVGCSKAVDTRVTNELVLGDRIVVEWPVGVDARNVISVNELDGDTSRALSVAPVPATVK